MLLLRTILSLLWLTTIYDSIVFAASWERNKTLQERALFWKDRYAKIDYCGPDEERVLTISTTEALEMIMIATSKLDILHETAKGWPVGGRDTDSEISDQKNPGPSLKDLSAHRLSVLNTYRTFMDPDFVEISKDRRLRVTTTAESLGKLHFVEESLHAMLRAMTKRSNTKLEITCDDSWMSVEGSGAYLHPGMLYDGRASVPSSGGAKAIERRWFDANHYIPKSAGGTNVNEIIAWFNMAPPYTTVLLVPNVETFVGSSSTRQGTVDDNEIVQAASQARPDPEDSDGGSDNGEDSGSISDYEEDVDYPDIHGFLGNSYSIRTHSMWPNKLSDLKTKHYEDGKFQLEDIFKAYLAPRLVVAFSSMPSFTNGGKYTYEQLEPEFTPGLPMFEDITASATSDPDAYTLMTNFGFLVLALYLEDYDWSQGHNTGLERFRFSFIRNFSSRSGLSQSS